MSLHAAAQHLAAQGRGEDKVLIHMTPGEVRGLQAIAMAHGGSLTINPSTGLPEAGFLSKILPMVAGAGLMAMTGGAAGPAAAGLFGLGMPATIGLGVGGIEALRTGNLGKGLMAGLGAYGGAGLMGGLASAGVDAAASAAQSNIDPGMLEGMSKAQVAATAPNAPILGSQTLGDAYSGLQNITNNPAQGLSNLWQGMGDSTKKRLATTAALASPLLEQEQKDLPTAQGSGPNPYSYTYQPNVTTPFPVPDVPGYGDLNRNFGREQRFYSGQYVPSVNAAEGGAVEGYAMGGVPVGAMNTNYPQSGISQSQYANAWQTPVPREMLTSGTDTGVNPMTGQMNFAQGGISDLGGYSDGGRLLRGPGDGVSDSIPAMIGNKQPARLADGEFVVPARIVSELGNGSTESGARKLYAMMDRVQKARRKTVGKGRVAANSRADRYLPA